MNKQKQSMEERVRPKIKRILKDHNMKIDWDCLCDDKILKIINAEINLAKKELTSSRDWRLIPMIKIFALKQHADKLCGMDAIEDIDELHKRIDALLKEKLN